jgi:hypothetical protein
MHREVVQVQGIGVAWHRAGGRIERWRLSGLHRDRNQVAHRLPFQAGHETGRWRRPPLGVERLRGLDPRRIMTPQLNRQYVTKVGGLQRSEIKAPAFCIIYEPEK